MRIRLVTPAEHAAVGELTVAVYGSLPGGRLSEEYAAILRMVAERAAVADVVVAVDEDDRLLGSVTFCVAPNPYAEVGDPGDAEFRMLVVDPAAQGRGVGRALVEGCLDRARERGAPRVVLSSTKWMTVAHGLYERMGFVRTPSRDWAPRPGIDLVTYALDLATP